MGKPFRNEGYMTSPIVHYILTSIKKFQALAKHDRENFQDVRFLHILAQREFGPMATGIVGVSDTQIQRLEEMVEGLSGNKVLFDALVKSYIFQDIGRIPSLKEKYKNEINPADPAQAGEYFIKREKFAERYDLDEKGEEYLRFLIKNHDLLHHIIRGEFSISTMTGVIEPGDSDLVDAFLSCPSSCYLP